MKPYIRKYPTTKVKPSVVHQPVSPYVLRKISTLPVYFAVLTVLSLVKALMTWSLNWLQYGSATLALITLAGYITLRIIWRNAPKNHRGKEESSRLTKYANYYSIPLTDKDSAHLLAGDTVELPGGKQCVYKQSSTSNEGRIEFV